MSGFMPSTLDPGRQATQRLPDPLLSGGLATDGHEAVSATKPAQSAHGRDANDEKTTNPGQPSRDGTGNGRPGDPGCDPNVWTPEPASRKLRPVMVWAHGGAKVSGSTADVVPFPGFEGFLYDGSVLAGEHDVVVVSMNYRLGVFGFFGHAGLAGEDTAFPYGGNQGLLDQRAALAWVRDNIAAFGGDPRQVTILGESAGAFDVCAHVVSPMSRGLFRGAIGESGACAVGVATALASAAAATAVADAGGCGGALDALTCLRAAPVADLLAAGEDALAGNALGISIAGARRRS
jgi:para-nitrobenzyl esterase